MSTNIIYIVVTLSLLGCAPGITEDMPTDERSGYSCMYDGVARASAWEPAYKVYSCANAKTGAACSAKIAPGGVLRQTDCPEFDWSAIPR